MELQHIEVLVASGTELHAGCGATVTEIEGGMVVKHGPRVREGEASAMEFVFENTCIRVPKVFAVATNQSTSTTYIVQEKLPGTPLLEVLPSIDAATCTSVAEQLARILRELSKLDGRGSMGQIGRSYYESGLFGRFKTPCIAVSTEEFISYIIEQGRGSITESQRVEYTSPIDNSRPPIFSHGDFTPDNILVEDGQVTGIIDWESAGWYPYFWNDFIARYRLHMPKFKGKEWEKMLPILMMGYPKEVFGFGYLYGYADIYAI